MTGFHRFQGFHRVPRASFCSSSMRFPVNYWNRSSTMPLEPVEPLAPLEPL